jgi:hypothetical protein
MVRTKSKSGHFSNTVWPTLLAVSGFVFTVFQPGKAGMIDYNVNRLI